MIEHIYQFGDQIKLKRNLDCGSILKHLEDYQNEWSQYNTFKPLNNRQGLSVINENGIVGPGVDLTSLYEWNKLYGTNYVELDFNTPTPIYETSEHLKNLFGDIVPYCFRTHFLRLGYGGFFPPHRDHYMFEQTSFRLVVPIKNCNPPYSRFMIEDRTLHWEMGSLYVVNTTKEHTLFNASEEDNIWLIINVKLCEETVKFVSRNLSII